MHRRLSVFIAVFAALAIPAMGSFANSAGLVAKLTVVQPYPHLELAASKGRAGGGAGYSCEGLQCTCQGDVDCNDMFGSGKCGDVASCDNDTGICKCLILKKAPVRKLQPEKVPLSKSVQ